LKKGLQIKWLSHWAIKRMFGWWRSLCEKNSRSLRSQGLWSFPRAHLNQWNNRSNGKIAPEGI